MWQKEIRVWLLKEVSILGFEYLKMMGCALGLYGALETQSMGTTIVMLLVRNMLAAIVVSCGHHNKVPQTGRLKRAEISSHSFGGQNLV